MHLYVCHLLREIVIILQDYGRFFEGLKVRFIVHFFTENADDIDGFLSYDFIPDEVSVDLEFSIVFPDVIAINTNLRIMGEGV